MDDEEDIEESVIVTSVLGIVVLVRSQDAVFEIPYRMS